MVSLRHVGGLAARALLFVSARSAENSEVYGARAAQAAQTLQRWYNASQGLWDTTGWWNGANCLTVLADLADVDGRVARPLGIAGVIANTFVRAQTNSSATVRKTVSPNGLTQTTYTTPSSPHERIQADTVAGFPGFINQYYDDEGWWALALIRSWDVTRRPAYLRMAERIFADMQGGTDGTCGGGLWWDKSRGYKNAIANELYLSVAASLANRVAGRRAHYREVARRQWAWFRASGLINGDGHVNDGLAILADGRCVNNNQTAWSYNQGVVLGGLVELARAEAAPRRQRCLDEAHALATAALALLSDAAGILHDAACEPSCGADGNQFKGIFVRNLGYLHAASPRRAYAEALWRNADSIWRRDRDPASGQLGGVWSGPYDAGGAPTAATHSSAMDALVAALRAAS